MTASRHDLHVIGQVEVKLKIKGFSWNWNFLVSRKLIGCPILGTNFLKENKIILDLSQFRFAFGFSPTNYLRFCEEERVCERVNRMLPVPEVRHIRGTRNAVPDALSRMYNPPSEEAVNQEVCQFALTGFPMAFHDFSQLRQDPSLREIMSKLKRGEKVDNYFLQDNALFWAHRDKRRMKLVVPAEAKQMVFAYFHDSPVGGQLGFSKTLSKIKQQFTWKNIYRVFHVFRA